MDLSAEDWSRVKAVFEGALALDGAARSAYVVEKCGGDSTLRRHVDALLDAHDRARSFLETPAVVTFDRTENLIGRTVGSYRIEARIGAGGMGEVYRARDEKLPRVVAVKLLPLHFTLTGSSIRRTADTRLAGMPVRRACSWTVASSARGRRSKSCPRSRNCEATGSAVRSREAIPVTSARPRESPRRPSGRRPEFRAR
jgi:hypothetical protein